MAFGRMAPVQTQGACGTKARQPWLHNGTAVSTNGGCGTNPAGRRIDAMIRSWILGTTALALAAGPVSIQHAMAQQKNIKIGFISSFSGSTAAIGNDMRNSFEIGLDHVGRKI